MRREKIVEEIKSAIEELGIPEHLYGVKMRSSEVHCDVAFGSQRITFGARSGTAEKELRANLKRLADAWTDHVEGVHQFDLEEIIAEDKTKKAERVPS